MGRINKCCKEEMCIRDRDIPFICQQYDKLAAEMVKRHGKENDFNFFHFMIDLTGGPCVYTVSYTHLGLKQCLLQVLPICLSLRKTHRSSPVEHPVPGTGI